MTNLNDSYFKLEIEPIIDDYELENEWNIWIHHDKNNWKIDGYRKIFTIKTIKDFWTFHNNIHIISGIYDSFNDLQIFLMRNNILPIWEDNQNRNGGCWSLKTNNNDSFANWVTLGSHIIGEILINDNSSQQINGLSFSLKNNISSIIKIWLRNSKNITLDLLNKKISEDFGYNLIFKAHLIEY